MKIRALAAIDSMQGLANKEGIPWDLPSDKRYVRRMTADGSLLMGFGTYKELPKPLPGRYNYVYSNREISLRKGFYTVTDLKSFPDNAPEKLWVFGGAKTFAQTINYIDEIYITQLNHDFACTKFFPAFKDDFELVSETKPQSENGIKYKFQIWRRKH